jgi:N-methylhydantoinase A/oxoprolinase/acetone carboxylase beta subunit
LPYHLIKSIWFTLTHGPASTRLEAELKINDRSNHLKKKICAIACAVLAIDMRYSAEELGLDIDYKFLEAGLHNNPKLLKEKLQAAIDEVSTTGLYDLIIIGYGICGKGTIGVQAHGIPLVIPKVHDCVALFLGGDQAYKNEFKKYPGTYYLSAGWCEEKTEPISQRKQWAYFGDEKLNFNDLVKTHGKNTAQTTFNFLNSWQKNYQRAAFIETGAKAAPKYEKIAKEMAKEYKWKYDKIKGSQDLVKKLITATHTTSDILFVPQDHVIGFDAIQSTLSANPILDLETRGDDKASMIEISNQEIFRDDYIKTGLGIDAGGTYTDAVIYDLKDNKTLCKSKSLTTKWDFTKGIHRALKKLDQEKLHLVELVALSTTLATNAIVENEGQKVGMMLMPPYGIGIDKNISHHPKSVIQGQLEITGRQTIAIDPYEVRQKALQMVENHGVTAFAVSGFAGSINPEHEIYVKKIIQEHTGLFVTCGHELSDSLNFQTRAVTAMLNARIIPRLASLLLDLEKVMTELGIYAPIVVVKGDGTLMSAKMAKQQPVETILSGPAASVAGARHLTGIKDALVVDMGGTTTDTATLKDNLVSLNEKGSNVGGHRTHVKALEIRTAGLGGDSLIEFEKGEFHIGPKRVAPIAWLGQMYPGTKEALQFLNKNMQRHAFSTRKMQLLAVTKSVSRLELTPLEKKIVSLLKKRPHSIDELVLKTNVLSDISLPLHRLEENFILQRCGLTLTDILHVTGQFIKWDTDMAREYCRMFSFLSKKQMPELTQHLLDMEVNLLTLELLKRQLDDETDPQALDTCPVCKVLINNLITGNNPDYEVSINIKRPIIGIGAPIQYFLPKAVKPLGAKAILPEDADVANAIGAITSNVVIKKQLKIIPGDNGDFIVEGIAGTRHFKNFDNADRFARKKLIAMVRERALNSGTSSQKVILETRDQIPTTATGDPIFMGRTLFASLTGRPDIVLGPQIL